MSSSFVATATFAFTALFVIIEVVSVGFVVGAAEILDAPQNQYILQETNATIICNTRGTVTYWVLNDTSITTSHPDEQPRYESYGVTFIESKAGGLINLTMIVPANATAILNNTKIVCTVRDNQPTLDMSMPVYLTVFASLRPYPPTVSTEVVYSLSSLPVIHARITGQPLWPGYVISEFNLNITRSSHYDDDDIDNLLQTDILNDCSNYSCLIRLNVSDILPQTLHNQCNVLTMSTSSVSDSNGISEPTQVEIAIFRPPESFPEKAFNHTTLFYANGALFSVTLQVKLPDVCIHQPANYTVVVEELLHQGSVEILRSGPHDYLGPSEVVSHKFDGLAKDASYSVRVLMNSVIWSTESSKYYFDTKLVNVNLSPTGGLSITDDGNGDNFYAIALGIPLVIVILLLLILSGLFLSYCLHTRSVYATKNAKQQGEASPNNNMVQNPIYDDGPVYEVVTSTSQEDNDLALSLVEDRHKSSPVPIHYVDEPTEVLNHHNKSTTIIEGYDHLTTTKGLGCRSNCGRTLKSPVDSEESYTVMSPAGALNGHY